MTANNDVRTMARENSVFLWQIAIELGISEPTLLRWLRVELPEKKRERVVEAIKVLCEKKEQGGSNGQ